ncbi:hypothetical protein [Hymenobacter sp. B81]|uniref:hypothetical protein n=1 Tax=Hymenobacter sp. B81 TaxID=3344878 RepID=UPI0037DDA782
MSENSNTPAVAARSTASTVSRETIEKLVLAGDLSKMDPAARVAYYLQLCESLKLNPHTQPFQILRLSGKEVMYATKSCTEQLRKLNGVSVTKLETAQPAGLLVVTAYVRDKKGRTDASTGAVVLEGLKGEALANAYMKAETKAKRRATLSICGLGMLDESELDTLKGAQPVALPDLGTSAEVVAEPAPVAEQAPAPMAVNAFQAPAAEPAPAHVGQLPDMPSIDAEGVAPAAERYPNGETPAEAAQKQEIIALLNHPVVRRSEKSKMLLNIHKLTQARANQAIDGLRTTIPTRKQERQQDAQELLDFVHQNEELLGEETAARLRRLGMDPKTPSDVLREEKMNAAHQLANVA